MCGFFESSLATWLTSEISPVGTLVDLLPRFTHRTYVPAKPNRTVIALRSSISPTSPWLFEVAWEVCNQIGGIYTVIRTKAQEMVKRWGDNYFLIGPYAPEAASIEFEEGTAPEALRPALAALESRGVVAHFGRWLVNGKPQTILFDFRPRYPRLHLDKHALYADNGITSDDADAEVNATILFGFAVAEFLEELSRTAPRHPLAAQFHEWMAGIALPRLAHRKVPVASTFTTHATLLGRYCASDNPHFYDHLESIDPESAARHYNIRIRYVLERVAAQTATVFTTISEVTAREAQHFLGRAPEKILPNGLNIHRFAALHEFQNLHLQYKERIHEFVMGHFFPSYTFDLDKTVYIFTSGRYEYRNKGFDVFIESLYRLNTHLKQLPNPPTVIAFLVTRAPTKNISVGAIQRHLMFEELRKICTEVQEGIGQRLLGAVARGKVPSNEELLSHDLQVRLKRAMHARKSDRLPSIVTHDMVDDGNDAILRHLRHRHLFNNPGDPVKVIFHPDFLSANNPLIGLDYDQFVRGCHLGVFPSYYEPWGYTPPECLALGIPAVTTDLTGFGAFVTRNIPRVREQGVYVLNRSKKGPGETIEDLASYLFNFTQLGRRERIELRNRAERLSDLFDWSVLVRHYHEAHEDALEKFL